MDSRFQVYAADSKRDDVGVFLHPTASIDDVRNGAATDAVDLSNFVKTATQTATQVTVLLVWNYELFGSGQPQPNQVLEVRVQGLPLFIGIINSLESYRVSRGERSMQLIARSRNTFDLWKTSKRVTPAYPLMTEYSEICRQIAVDVGLPTDGIVLPYTSYSTVQPTVQLSNMSAWEMLTAVLLPCGLTPFIDGTGRLRAMSRIFTGATPDLVLSDFISVNANRQRNPTSRVILKWTDPELSIVVQQGRKLHEQVITMGFFLPGITKYVHFSDDQTQRAKDTYLVIKQSANSFIPVCSEDYTQYSPVAGTINLVSYGWTSALLVMIAALKVYSLLPDMVQTDILTGTGITISQGRKIQAAGEVALALIMASIGTGIYEIWGSPYNTVNAKNTSVAYDSSIATFVDNPVTIDSDLVTSEAHAQQVCTNELIYKNLEANSWSVDILDNLNIEQGDKISFPDGSLMLVVDYSRDLMRGGNNVLSVSGFLIHT